MGRSIARHSNSLKNFYISWMDELGVDSFESSQHAWAWGDFKRSVVLDLKRISDTFDRPHDETWPEDEVMLLASNGHAKVVVSEYMGLACIGIVAQPRQKPDAWGHITEVIDHLAVDYCNSILEPKLEARLTERFDLYRAGATTSNGTQMFYPA